MNTIIDIDYLVLVNKKNKLSKDWIKNVELVNIKNFLNEEVKVEKETLKNFNRLKESLKKEGIVIDINSSYRSIEEQKKIWDMFKEECGMDYVEKYVATPGYSEHHTGLVIDICIINKDKLICDNEDMIAQQKLFSKIHKQLPKFGFILRYPEGKEDITGYNYEPWHFRYVGSKKIAKEIMDNNLTLEEYLKK